MRFVTTNLPGCYVVEQERHSDERGFFARFWSTQEFAAHGLEAALSQSSTSFNERRGTLRGLHYQVPPSAETKLVRCTRGAIYDVAVDLRPDSPGFRRWFSLELTPENGRALYVPRGFAHGFLTLAEESEVEYQISTAHAPEHARGIRWNDPAFAVRWPGSVEVVSARDRDYPNVSLSDLDVLRGL